LLKKKFDFLHAKMDQLAGLLETLDMDNDNTAETLAGKIEKLLQERMQASFKRIQRKK
jgi:hypothetical protein